MSRRIKHVFAPCRHLAPSTGLLVCLLLTSGTAHATIVGAAPVEELTARADLVLRARVSRLESRLYDEGRKVATLVEMRVLETYKGEVTETVEIVVPGGSHGEIVQVVRGAPGFLEGEEVVLFLEHARPVARPELPQRFRLVSLSLGAFLLQDGVASRKKPAPPVRIEPFGRPRLPEPPEVELPLDRLEERIRAGLREDLP